MPHARSTVGDERLLAMVEVGDMRAVEQLLASGTNADGSVELSYRPLMVAAKYGYSKIMKLLLRKGAGVEAKTNDNGRDIYGRPNTIPAGTRALHAVAFSGSVESLNVLLQAGADPNVVDSEGYTTLMAVCSEQGVADTRLAMVRVLLEAGANPAASTYSGLVAMHMAASTDATDVIDLLSVRAPTTLNHITKGNATPLSTAALHGHEGAVAQLLTLGATDAMLALRGVSALTTAVTQNHAGVVRILLGSAQSKKAVGGSSLVPEAMSIALSRRGRNAAKILQMLLAVQERDGVPPWAGQPLMEGPMLHATAASISLEGTHVLLAAGADETETNRDGERAIDFIGAALPVSNKDAGPKAALRRMLRRGPAFRARSWAWSPLAAGVPPPPPPDGEVLLTTPDRSPPAGPLGVRIFRPTGRRFLTRCFVR